MAILGGYPVEEHAVRTSDDYILKMYRIPGGRNGKKINPYFPPVVLVHGMMTSSRDFLLMGPDKSLGIGSSIDEYYEKIGSNFQIVSGFILADAGYDVWMPNMRFNQYASHVTKLKSDPSYWDFEWVFEIDVFFKLEVIWNKMKIVCLYDIIIYEICFELRKSF